MRTRHLVPAVLAAAMFVLAGCGDDDGGSSADTGASSETTASPTADVCAARDDLRTALTDLGSLNVLQDGTDAAREYVDKVGVAIGDLKSAAADAYESETAAVEEALQGVRDALDAGVSVDNLQQAAKSLGDLATSGAALLTAIGDAC